MKSIGMIWCAHIPQTMYDLRYKTYDADPYVWMKENSKIYLFYFYEYVFIHGDDVLSVIHKPSVFVDSLHKIYCFKEPPEKPYRYLGVSIGKFKFDDVTFTWYHSYEKCLKNAVLTVDENL